MTKTWESWKDEIIRLYVTKSMTLKEVQAILMGQGFDASIRAYRIKLEAWGVRKNSSVHERRKHRLHSTDFPKSITTSLTHTVITCFGTSQASLSVPEEASVEEIDDLPLSVGQLDLGEFDIGPNTIRNMEELLIDAGFDKSNPHLAIESLFNQPLPPASLTLPQDYLLLIMLALNWKLDGTYLQPALNRISCMEIDILLYTPWRLFRLIAIKGGTGEGIHLAGCFLKRLVASSIKTRDVYPWETPRTWREFLWVAIRQPSWAKRKALIDDCKSQQGVVGELFCHAVSVAIAEDLLADLMSKLSQAIGINGDGVDTSGKEDDVDVRREREMEDMRSEFMTVLNDFSDSTAQLDPKYYRFAVRMNKWFEGHDNNNNAAVDIIRRLGQSFENKCADLGAKLAAVEQLVPSYNGPAGYFASELMPLVDENNKDNPQCLAMTPSRIQPPSDSPSTSMRHIPNLYFRLSYTRRIFQGIFQIWKQHQDLVPRILEDDLTPLTLDHRYTSVGKRLGPNRLFSLIAQHVDSRDQGPFICALLTAFAQCKFMTDSSNSIDIDHSDGKVAERWISLLEAPDWNYYKELRDDVEHWVSFESDATKIHLKTILDCTTVVVCKRILKCIDADPASYISEKQPFKEIKDWLLDHRHLLVTGDYAWVHRVQNKMDLCTAFLD